MYKLTDALLLTAQVVASGFLLAVGALFMAAVVQSIWDGSAFEADQ